MSRDLTLAVADELTQKNLRPIILYEGEFEAGILRLWTGVGELQWNGQTWTGGGIMLGFDTIEETTEIVAAGVNISLSGLASEVVAAALGQARLGKRGTLWLGLLDAAGQVIADPLQIFSGLLDVPSIQRNGASSTINASYESRLVGLTKPNERRYTPEDQKVEFPDDTGFDYVAGLQDASLVW